MSKPPSPRPGRNPLNPRRAIYTLGILVVLALIFFGVGGWHFSGQIESGALAYKYDPSKLNLEVVAANSETIEIIGVSENEKLGIRGVWGIESKSAYGRVHEIQAEDGDAATRQLVAVSGEFRSGDPVRIDTYTFDGDPQSAHGIDFETAIIDGPLGELPAWFVPGDRDTWAIFVHGRRASRQEALRLLPVTVEQGLPSLVVTYRGDDDVAPDPSGYYGYGSTEWTDLEAAVRYALDQGASDVALVGYSMGGGVVMSFMQRSELSASVAGLVLDAPMLNFGLTIDHNAAREKLPLVGLPVPGPMTDIAKWLASVRFDVDWDATDYTGLLGELSIPVLLFHGAEDPTVPVESSRRFAKERTDIVQYIECDDAPHVSCWNVDPGRYESVASEFLSEFKD